MSVEHPLEEPRTITAALDRFRDHGGMLRTREALETGIRTTIAGVVDLYPPEG